MADPDLIVAYAIVMVVWAFVVHGFAWFLGEVPVANSTETPNYI